MGGLDDHDQYHEDFDDLDVCSDNDSEKVVIQCCVD